MKNALLALAAFASLFTFAEGQGARAQNASVVATCGTLSLPTGYANAPLVQDTTGTLCATGGGGGGGGAVTVANGADVAEGATTDAAATNGGTGTVSAKLRTLTGNLGPVTGGAVAASSSLAGGQYNFPLPALTNGQQAALQVGNTGSLNVTLWPQNSNSPLGAGTSGDGTGPQNALFVNSQLQNFDGTNYTRLRNITGHIAAGTGTTAVALGPVSIAAAGITPTVTSAVASSLVGKGSAGNLYAWRITTGGTAGYVMFFNATSAPADGAVTPVDCVAVSANATTGGQLAIPEVYSTGITLVFSSTGCFTKTASATAFMKADVK